MKLYNDKLEPVCKLGDYLAELNNRDSLIPKRMWQATFIEPLPSYKHDFGAITATNSVDEDNMTELQLTKGRIAQYRFTPLDDLKIDVFLGRGNKRSAIRTSQFSITPANFGLNPSGSSTEIWTMEDKEIFLTITNLGSQDYTKSRVLFYGNHYYVQEVDLKAFTEDDLATLSMNGQIAYIPTVVGGA